MEDLTQWFRAQLTSSAEAFTWAVEQVLEERRLITPLERFGEWSVARHIFHMMYYEKELALPSMRLWLGEPFHMEEEDYQEDQSWETGHDLQTLLAEFCQVRAEEVALLERFDAETWQRERDDTIWGKVTLRWVVSKTLQHTFEHNHDVLRMALFWRSPEEQAESA